MTLRVGRAHAAAAAGMVQPFVDAAVAPIRLPVALAELQEIAPPLAAIVDTLVRADAGAAGMAAVVECLALEAPEPACLSRATFIDGLDIHPELKARLRGLTSESYTGLASQLAQK